MFIVKITFTYENQSYDFQLDNNKQYSVESLAKDIAAFLGISEPLFISTQENRGLLPFITIIVLVIINPDNYGNLKVFKAKQHQQSQIKQQTNYPSTISQVGDDNLNSNREITFDPNGVSLKYKKDFEEYCLNKKEQKSPNNNDEKKNEDIDFNNSNEIVLITAIIKKNLPII